MISTTSIDQLNSLSLVDVISHYVQLKKKGANHEACCPFHDEKTPSFSVNAAKGLYKCFGCGKGGNRPIQFVMDKTGLPFVQACEELARAHGITLQYEHYDSTELKQKAEQKADLYKINEAAARQYAKQLVDIAPNHAANKMIFDRWGWAGHEQVLDTVITWQLGYAPDQWQFLAEIVNEKALNEQAHTLGLVKEKNERTYDNYRNRLIFPIHNLQGHIVAFGGRAMGDDKPKFLNSDDSPIYNKSETLYGLFHAKNAIAKSGFAYLTEGYADVISFHLAGATNTVATCGTALTEQQAKTLKRFCQTVVLAYDADKAGLSAIEKATEILLPMGFTVLVCAMPAGEDPDSLTRSTHWREFLHKNANRIAFNEFLEFLTTDAITWKASRLLNGVTNLVERNNAFNTLARTLAMLDDSRKVMRSDLAKAIAKTYNLDFSTFRTLIDEQLSIRERKEIKQKRVRKNTTAKLNGNATTYPFFEELTDNKGNFKGIHINKVKFVQLLSHFGFTRYGNTEGDDYNFVRLQENIIASVKKDEIIDFVENFIEKEYDFDASGLTYVTPEDVKNKFYDGMRSYFSKDLFARMRTEQPIIINNDDREHTYFYYQNGFVTIDKNGWQLQPYEDMDGSVWKEQMLDRDFVNLQNLYGNELDLPQLGVFADFVYRISGGYKSETTDDPEKQREYFKRFYSLCTIIGYIVHDFYEYKLKAILLTDSSMSDESDGRTGKTLLGKLIGKIRSYCEINGKDFDAHDKNKYESATQGTQVLHLNDVKNKGRNRFDFEDVFNDVTEGYTVNAKYMQPFKKISKMIISTNKTLHITGGSQRDRIIQFELSDFFNEKHSPAEFYGHWLMLEWDDSEWHRFDNFMCYCARLFHEKGIIEPSTINLELRVLRDHTCQEFIDFMADIAHNLKEIKLPFRSYTLPENATMFDAPVEYTMSNFEFEKKQLYNRFREDYEDYRNANWFTQHIFTKWLKMYAKYILGVEKPITRRSNGKDMIIFRAE